MALALGCLDIVVLVYVHFLALVWFIDCFISWAQALVSCTWLLRLRPVDRQTFVFFMSVCA